MERKVTWYVELISQAEYICFQIIAELPIMMIRIKKNPSETRHKINVPDAAKIKGVESIASFPQRWQEWIIFSRLLW